MHAAPKLLLRQRVGIYYLLLLMQQLHPAPQIKVTHNKRMKAFEIKRDSGSYTENTIISRAV
jgi:hypothetical protein